MWFATSSGPEELLNNNPFSPQSLAPSAHVSLSETTSHFLQPSHLLRCRLASDICIPPPQLLTTYLPNIFFITTGLQIPLLNKECVLTFWTANTHVLKPDSTFLLADSTCEKIIFILIIAFYVISLNDDLLTIK